MSARNPGRSGTRTCFGPRNSKTVYQNSRLSTHPHIRQKLSDMTIEEKYLEVRKKSVNQKNNRYLFTNLENRPNSCLHRVV